MKKKLLWSCIALSVLSGTAPLNADNVYTIYPIPQEQIAGSGTAAFSAEVNIVAEPAIDQATRNRAQDVLTEHGFTVTFGETAVSGKTNVLLGVAGSAGIADNQANTLQLDRSVLTKTGKFDRHIVSLTAEDGVAQVLILGENTDATFYGLASLEQMLETDVSAMPLVTINDYADQHSRGLVEGYYGYPYKVSVKKDLMRFMMRYKMNTYMYGAKSDPYHSEKWGDPYPTSITAEQENNGWLTQDMVKEITDVSHQTKVNFIWAIHPGTNFIYSSTVIDDMMKKFDLMYQLGVRQFGVFVDDVYFDTSDEFINTNATRLTEIQQALESKYNTTYTTPADTVKPIHFVPHVYAAGFAGTEDRQRYFQALASTPSNIVIYTTGWGVWSVPNSRDLLVIKQDLGRDVAWWWNYPCNDNADAYLYPMDTYTNFKDMPAVDGSATLPSALENGLGIVANPMQQGEVSKTALFSVADYAWNNAAFNNLTSWEASFKAVVGEEYAEAYQTVAKYLRISDPATLNLLITNYKNSLTSGNPAPEQLQTELTNVLEACNTVASFETSENESLRLLYQDIRPWLNKVRQMLSSSINLMKAAEMSNDEAGKWEKYIPEVGHINGFATEEQYKAYALEGMGSSISVSVRPAEASNTYLNPFVNWMKENAMQGLFPASAATKATRISNHEGVKGTISTTNNLVFLTISAANAVTLAKGEYVGIAFAQPTKLTDATVADTLVANYSVLYSENGKSWTKYTTAEDLCAHYAKYVVVLNESEAPKSLKLVKAIFSFTLPAPTSVSSVAVPTRGSSYNNYPVSNIYDGDLTTYYAVQSNQQTGDTYTLTLATEMPIEDVRVAIGTVNGDYMNQAKLQISSDGTSWKDLNIKGTSVSTITMSHPKVVKYSDEVSYIDMQGTGETAKYVRLYVSSANTSKWLRLYDILVNQQSYLAKFAPVCVDGSGNALAEVTDAKPFTSASPEGSSLVYNFQQIAILNNVVVYQDASGVTADNAAEVSVTEDGENWTSLGKLTEAVQSFDLSAYPEAMAIRLQWSTTAPQVYQIVENADESKQVVISGIETVESVSGTRLSLTAEGTLCLAGELAISQVEMFTADGRLVYAQQAGGAKSVSVPVGTVAGSTAIVRARMQNGSVASYKVWLK